MLLLSFWCNFPLESYLCLAIYFAVNIGYSLGLKNVPILDIALLVSGFLLRVLFGAAVTGIAISDWLYLTVIAISFYLGLGKRRGELARQKGDTRKVLKYYTYDYLDQIHAESAWAFRSPSMLSGAWALQTAWCGLFRW